MHLTYLDKPSGKEVTYDKQIELVKNAMPFVGPCGILSNNSEFHEACMKPNCEFTNK